MVDESEGRLSWHALVRTYGAWLIVVALATWFFFLFRTSFYAVAVAAFIQGSLDRARLVNFLDKMFMLMLGLAWLGLLYFSESYFRTGARRGSLSRRFARVLSVLLLLVFAADFSLLWAQGWGVASPLRWALIAVQAGAGVLLLIYGYAGRRRADKRRSTA